MKSNLSYVCLFVGVLISTGSVAEKEVPNPFNKEASDSKMAGMASMMGYKRGDFGKKIDVPPEQMLEFRHKMQNIERIFASISYSTNLGVDSDHLYKRRIQSLRTNASQFKYMSELEDHSWLVALSEDFAKHGAEQDMNAYIDTKDAFLDELYRKEPDFLKLQNITIKLRTTCYGCHSKIRFD
jgi:hypothetical protein